jgi:hypothetical protein
MCKDPALEELWRIKEKMAAKYGNAHKLGAAVRRYVKRHPFPPPGPHRKMIPGFPCGQSVANF